MLGKKIGMTQIYNKDGAMVPITVVEAGPCVVLQVKSSATDGYNAVQLGFDNRKPKNVNAPDMGHFKKANAEPVRFVKEIRLDKAEEIKPADKVTVEIFEVGEYVDITGNSIGKGFQGGIKRWNWHGGDAAHGSMFHRAPGSLQSGPRLRRVTKGHHLPGHMGDEAITVQGLEIIEVDKDNNMLLLKGAVPGPKGNYLVINKSFKKKKKLPKPEGALKKKKEDPLKASKKAMKKKV